MPPYVLEQLSMLHPAQQAAFYELIMWSNSGTPAGIPASAIACEKALEWAKQVPIPPPLVEEEES